MTSAGPAAAPRIEARPSDVDKSRLDWLDPIKALALLGILLNHFVEEFGPGPWFTNPTASWPALSTRVATAIPHGSGPLWGAVRMLGWLGDAAPGVFIFASGVGLTLSALRNGMDAKAFYRRRLLRLYPLYIAMHVVILGGALFVPGNTLSFGTPATLLSLAGLRFTRGLFFYISPSWWFVWLILQIYIVYPILFRGLERLGPMRFFVGALAFTVVSRGVGLALPPIRYDWLTGMFFGSRLAEFAAGMVAAWWITNGRQLPSVGWAIASYGLGFGAQFFLPTVVVSNLLITLGMTGVFYAIWRMAPAAWM
ncbi:MAG TPA: acyltransferase family protein, partial [Gemmatimonadaceae bacterium]|nr:acyltransferase family protein [Gemmatimonadaceae bacterium]